MKTTLISTTAVAWLCAGVLLAGWAVLDQVPRGQILIGLLMACLGLAGASAGYAMFHRRRWAIWIIGALALAAGSLGIGYFIRHGFGWTHGSSDWMALGLVCFCTLSLIAIVLEVMRRIAEPDDATNEHTLPVEAG
jgi:hypothetical protein